MKHPKKINWWQKYIMGRKLVQGEIVDVFYSKRIPFGGDVTLYNLKKTDGKNEL